jgi:hypothetical protein
MAIAEILNNISQPHSIPSLPPWRSAIFLTRTPSPHRGHGDSFGAHARGFTPRSFPKFVPHELICSVLSAPAHIVRLIRIFDDFQSVLVHRLKPQEITGFHTLKYSYLLAFTTVVYIAAFTVVGHRHNL